VIYNEEDEQKKVHCTYVPEKNAKQIKNKNPIPGNFCAKKIPTQKIGIYFARRKLKSISRIFLKKKKKIVETCMLNFPIPGTIRSTICKAQFSYTRYYKVDDMYGSNNAERSRVDQLNHRLCRDINIGMARLNAGQDATDTYIESKAKF
jgi:hypothetical protein